MYLTLLKSTLFHLSLSLTPIKPLHPTYVSASNITMATKNSKSIPITGLTDKRSITLTFTASLSGKFLSIYGGNKKASLPRGFDYPKRFCLTQNPKH